MSLQPVARLTWNILCSEFQRSMKERLRRREATGDKSRTCSRQFGISSARRKSWEMRWKDFETKNGRLKVRLSV